MVCRCFQQWPVEHSHIHRTGSGWPHSTDKHQDWLIVGAAVAASKEEIQVYVAPAVSQRTIGNCLLASGLRSCVLLVRLPLTPWYLQAWLLWCCERVDWRVEWFSVVFSDESRFCLSVSDGHTRVQQRPGEHRLLECIHPRYKALPQASWCGEAIRYNVWSDLEFLQVKVNSTSLNAQVVNPVLLPFIQKEGDVLFNRTTHVHIRLLQRNMLFVVYNNCPGHKNPRSPANWTRMGHDEVGTYSFSRACNNHCWIATIGQDA